MKQRVWNKDIAFRDCRLKMQKSINIASLFGQKHFLLPYRFSFYDNHNKLTNLFTALVDAAHTLFSDVSSCI